MNHERLITALLLCLLFTSAGWLAPVMIATHAPAGTYLDPVQLHVENVSTDDATQAACFTRDVKSDTTGLVVRELILVSGNSTVVAQEIAQEAFFRQGHRTVRLNFYLPSDLQPGVYRYQVGIEFTVGQTGVTRTQTIASNQFIVSNNSSAVNQAFSCG